jgi:predicted O-methyltransferase YrrM
MGDFASIWRSAESVPGWLTRAQAQRLYDSASSLEPGAVIVEIGSHQGRSTVVLAQAAVARSGRVTAIDPFIEGRLFGGVSTRSKFEQNVTDAGVADVVDLLPRPSQDVRPEWTAPVDLLYIDGKHDYWTVTDDLEWLVHLAPGREVLVHDAFSSIGVTLAILRHVLPSPSLRYLDRTGSLARFEVGQPSLADRLRIVAEVPWWLRNIAVKIALRVARPFGGTTPDPY